MDYSQYSKDWKDIIRPAILKRDSYKCRNCGIRHKSRVYKDSRGKYVDCDEFIEQWAKSNGKTVFTVFLAVAHIDQDKENNEPDNLLSLCPRCHTRHDQAARLIKRRIYKEKTQIKPADLSRLLIEACKKYLDLKLTEAQALFLIKFITDENGKKKI